MNETAFLPLVVLPVSGSGKSNKPPSDLSHLRHALPPSSWRAPLPDLVVTIQRDFGGNGTIGPLQTDDGDLVLTVERGDTVSARSIQQKSVGSACLVLCS